MSNFSFSVDEDIKIVLEGTAWCLQQYFDYSYKAAIESINKYYKENEQRLSNSQWGDDFYSYEGAYRVALRIVYCQNLNLGDDRGIDFVEWMRNNYNVNVSRQLTMYLRQFYR